MSTATTTITATPTTLSAREQDPTYIPRGPVEATLYFYAPPEDGSRPFNFVETPPPGQPRRNYGDVIQKVTIHDIRNHESEYALDRDAFQTLQNVHSAAEPSFTDEENIKSVYYPEVEQLILNNVPGAHRVVIFDHTIRRANPDAARGPVLRTHIDQTAASAKQRVEHHLPEEAEELLKGRYRIINVWRPLNGPLQSNPLAFASSVSVRDQDVVGVEHRYPDRTGETAGVIYNESQKWHYWSGMTNDERLLLKCSDSGDVEGKRGPHTAFVDSRTPPGAPGRESIEVRTLVFG
ncbi:hypothetical protein FQN51_008285 [Onygenales sp. PD_10]|nr:hypothetical protein FQN51_008285 [Onygenales sp. PD_10]